MADTPDNGTPPTPAPRQPYRDWLLILGLALMVAAGFFHNYLHPANFHGTDLSGAEFGKDFHLRDAQGQPRSLADYRGKVVTLFFGYTQCPDVCPTNLSAMASVVKKLGADGDKLQVLFVTIDPERDTPALLQEYAPAFNPKFVGLWGDAAQTTQVIKDFRLIVKKEPGPTPSSYLVDHTASTYVFDPKGRLRLQFAHRTATDDMVADIRKLMQE